MRDILVSATIPFGLAIQRVLDCLPDIRTIQTACICLLKSGYEERLRARKAFSGADFFLSEGGRVSVSQH